MPIHDQSYRHYAGKKEPPGRTWLVIASAGVRSMIGKKKFLGLLLFAWLPFLVRTIQMYIAANFPQASVLNPTAETFRDFLDQQGVFVFFITIFVGAGLIANDKRANALQIYLAKPMTRAEYVAGKIAILATFLLLVTLVPAILLVFAQMILSGSTAFIRSNLFIVPAITVFSVVEVVVAAMTMAALSSASKSGRFVAILYTGVMYFSEAIYGVVFLVTRGTSLSWISLPGNLRQIGDVIFRLQPRYETHPAITLLALVTLIGVSLYVLERSVRGVEVVT